MTKVLEFKIEELSQELDALKAERDRLNEEARRRAEAKNLLHEEIEKLRLEAQTLKEKRDALNSEVQRLKTLREETWNSYRGKVDELKRLRQRIKEISSKKPRRSFQSLENEVKMLDWKIQTESLSLDDERRLVDQVKALESQLEVYREIRNIQGKIDMLENEVKELKDKVSAHHRRILEVAKQGQGFHEKMIEKLDRIRELKKEADKVQKEYIDHREKAKAFHLRYLEISGQVKAIRDEVGKKEEEDRAKHQADLKKKLEEEALGKLKRGEKLTFEEFKMLAEQEKI